MTNKGDGQRAPDLVLLGLLQSFVAARSDSVGLRPITTVTMAIAVGMAMIASRLSLVVVTD
jgi:hypothetical protein